MKHKHEDVKEHTRNNYLFEENQIIIEVDKRVKDFLFLLTEIKKKENVIEQFENKVIRKREGISKVKFEVEKNEQIYLEQYQNLTQNELSNHNEALDCTMSLDFPDNEEIPRRLMTNINYMRDEITSKLSEVKHKEKEFEEREKFFNNKFEGLSDEHKELFKNLEREFVKLNKSGVTTSQQLKENCSLANLQPDEVSLDLFKEMLQREEENRLIKSDQILNLKCLNFEEVINEMSNELHSLSKSKQNKNTTQENCVPNIDDIVDLHEIEMINNKEELLTDDLPSNSNSPNRKKINKKYGNITFEDLPTNKTFYMIKSKRAAESLKSSIEIDITDLGGARCCRKLQHNYDLNIQLTHSRSHSQQMISKKSYAVLKSTLNQQEAQTAKHEEVPKSKQIEATRVECKSQASLLPRNDNDSNGSSKRRKNKKLNSLIINGSIGKECRDDNRERMGDEVSRLTRVNDVFNKRLQYDRNIRNHSKKKNNLSFC